MAQGTAIYCDVCKQPFSDAKPGIRAGIQTHLSKKEYQGDNYGKTIGYIDIHSDACGACILAALKDVQERIEKQPAKLSDVFKGYYFYDEEKKLKHTLKVQRRALELYEAAQHGEWCNKPTAAGQPVRNHHDCALAPNNAYEYWYKKAAEEIRKEDAAQRE